MAVKMGAHSYWVGGPKTQLNSSDIVIGKYCSIASGVTMDDGVQHHTEWVTTSPLKYHFFGDERFGAFSKGDIVIGNDVWIGDDAMIMSGVHVGDGAVIGARAVVTKDVFPYSIVGGVPAKFIRYRFPWPVINKLMELKWWDWPDEKVRERMPLLLSPDYEALFKAEGL